MMTAIWARVIGHHREARGKCSPAGRPAGRPLREQSQRNGPRRVRACLTGARVFLFWCPQTCILGIADACASFTLIAAVFPFEIITICSL